jgi:hypothetical protein
MAFYWAALHSWCNEIGIDITNYKKETYIIGFQKGDLPECRVLQVSESWLNTGLQEIEDLLPRIKWHFDSNEWNHRQEYYTNNGIEVL